MVQTSARHLLELINDVLDISKIEAGQLEIKAEPFDLRASIERVVGLVEPFANKKQLKLTQIFKLDSDEMIGDRRRLEQILLNLLNNAIKFTTDGSVVLHIEAINNCTRNGSACPAVRFTVKDSGIGIKPEDIPALFRPFHQIDIGLSRQHEGSGLGLAICQRLTLLMGGEIAVRSEWLKGSEFEVILPRQLQPDRCMLIADRALPL
jgi:signal transduction histidine kinase